MIGRNVRRAAALAVLYLLAACGAASAQTRPPSAAKQDGIHAVLLVAGMSNVQWEARIPPTVAKALKDASQFLPFTYYELTDQAVLRGAGVNQQIRLRGIDAREYQLSVNTRPSADSADRIAVHVSLSESTSSLNRSDVMTTEYSARVGETVVVGTSKVKSGASEPSLVLLVTLIPRP